MYAYPAAQKSCPSSIFPTLSAPFVALSIRFPPFVILTQAVHIFGLIIEHNIFSAFLVGHNWRLRHESPQFPIRLTPATHPAAILNKARHAHSHIPHPISHPPAGAFPFNEIFPCAGRVNTLNRFQFFNISAFIGWHFFRVWGWAVGVAGRRVVEINL